MSKRETCESCAFWRPPGAEFEGECRAHTPERWRPTRAEDWCGEHMPNPFPPHAEPLEPLLPSMNVTCGRCGAVFPLVEGRKHDCPGRPA